MRFLVDMNLSTEVAIWRRAQGHDAAHLHELGLQELGDEAVLAKAAVEQRTVLTFDLDFADIATAARGRASPWSCSGCARHRRREASTGSKLSWRPQPKPWKPVRSSSSRKRGCAFAACRLVAEGKHRHRHPQRACRTCSLGQLPADAMVAPRERNPP